MGRGLLEAPGPPGLGPREESELKAESGHHQYRGRKQTTRG